MTLLFAPVRTLTILTMANMTAIDASVGTVDVGDATSKINLFVGGVNV